MQDKLTGKILNSIIAFSEIGPEMTRKGEWKGRTLTLANTASYTTTTAADSPVRGDVTIDIGGSFEILTDSPTALVNQGKSS